MKKIKLQAHDWLFVLSALLMLAGIILVNETSFVWGKYVFCAGGAGYVMYKLRNAYRGEDFRLKRLNRLHGFCGLLIILSAYLMFIGNNGFIVLLLLVAFLEIYLSFRTEHYRRDKDSL